MFSRFILLVVAFFATASAFAPAFSNARGWSKSLVMGSLQETFKFKKIMNRFTFKVILQLDKM
jgi:hypothetical protein